MEMARVERLFAESEIPSSEQAESLIICDLPCPSVQNPSKCMSCGGDLLLHMALNEEPQAYMKIRKNMGKMTFPIAIGLPSTGIVRYEWAATMMGLSIPMSFNIRSLYRAINVFSPVGYHVAEARNLIVQDFLATDSEWLFFIDHDVLLPPMTYAFLLEHIRARKYPIVSGLYCIKSTHYQPIILRGGGHGAYTDFKYGDQVECSGIPMGCALIHRSILQFASDHARAVRTSGGEAVKEVFRSPRDWVMDPETGKAGIFVGTEDLWFCDRVIENNVYELTGWTEPNKELPFLVDTRIRCSHIGMDGQVWPKAWPENMMPTA